MKKVFNTETGEYDYLPEEEIKLVQAEPKKAPKDAPKELVKALKGSLVMREPSQKEDGLTRQARWRERNAERYRKSRAEYMRRYRAKP